MDGYPLQNHACKGRTSFRLTPYLATPVLGRLTLVFLLGVIAWGAYVRASGSGAGCGSHWPLCNGQVVPVLVQTKTWVEFTHRVTSGLSLVLCVALCWSAFREYAARSFTRKAAVGAVVFIFLEAFLGAGLVLLELVAENKSVMRTVSLGVHLVNTFILLAAVVVTVHWSGKERQGGLMLRSLRRNRRHWYLAVGSLVAVLGVLVLGASGAMTALGDTLFPHATSRVGYEAGVEHFLIRLRVYHPLFAVFYAMYGVAFAFWVKKSFKEYFFSTLFAGLLVAQLLLGVMNILWLVPTPLQLAHLLMADGVWVMLILMLSSLWVIPQGEFE